MPLKGFFTILISLLNLRVYPNTIFKKMYKESSLSIKEKLNIAFSIKPITKEKAIQDYQHLVHLPNINNRSDRCRIGNDCVDYFTFEERLNTKGKYNVNFYEFIENIEEFKKKKFIQNMLLYYETTKNKNKTKNQNTVYKEVYNICISAINIFRPIVAMDIYSRFKPTSILDFTCGWGGRLLGACALNIPNYIGIDINKNLEIPYQKMKEFLNSQHSPTEINIIIKDALQVDYSKLDYDMVFTSPPYFFLEKYSFNNIYSSKEEMKNDFYEPIFKKTYDSLKKGGYYCLNINQEIFKEIAIPLFGPAMEEIPLKKSKRQNDYQEFIYVWWKSN